MFFFNGERVARKGFSGNVVSYYFSDHLKTASVITDSTGHITNESDYYPWGGELQFASSGQNHYKLGGKERDPETGCDYFGSRYYCNSLSRFITPDWSPIPHPVPYADFRDPQTLNLFSYVRSLPTTKFDEDGHQQKKSAEEEAREEEEFDKELREFNEFLRRTEQVEEAAQATKISEDNNKADDAKVKDGYDDVTGVCHVNSPPPKSGLTISAPNSPPKAPEFVVSTAGDVIVVPKGANPASPVVNKNGNITGFAFKGGSGGNGLHSNVTTVRIMNPTSPNSASPGYQNGYVVYQNAAGQTINPLTGRTVPPNDPMAHIPLSPPKTTLTSKP